MEKATPSEVARVLGSVVRASLACDGMNPGEPNKKHTFSDPYARQHKKRLRSGKKHKGASCYP
jgi:hypothetical protein